MKKCLELSLAILIVCIVIIGKVYAVSTEISLQTTKTEVKKEEEFSIEISLLNLQTETGVIAFSGEIEYDKNILTLVKMEGLNEWETPKDGISFNSETGKFVIERDSVGKNDESVLSISFKVKDDSKDNTTISLKNVNVADGRSPIANINLVQKTITIKKDVDTPSDPTPDNPTPDNPTQDDPTPDNPTPDNPTPDNPTPSNPEQSDPTPNDPTIKPTDKLDNTIADKDIPQTGIKNVWIIVIVVVVLGAGIFAGIKLKKYKF